MQKILLLLAVSFFVGKNCEAQNLVPNPSFEDTVSCPSNISEVFNCLGWSSCGISPDYFNSCNATTVGVPDNVAGFQQASTGNAYCGVFTYADSSGLNSNIREIIGRQLSSSLVPATKYYASVKVSLGDDVKLVSNNLGILFSTISMTNNVSSYSPSIIYPQIFSPAVITDYTNWITISGSFIADSAYQFIKIGNFLNDSLTTIINSTSPSAHFDGAYYYIDDVCVSPDSLACNLNPEGIYSSLEKNSITIFPNPASNELTVESVGSQQYAVGRIEITDAFGRKIFQSKNNLKSEIINLKSFSSGLYFIKVYFVDGSMVVRRFVKE